MRRKLTDFQPDLMHLFEPALLGIGGIYYSQELDIPLVVSYHTNLPAYLRYYKLGAIEGITWKLMRERHKRAHLNLCTSTVMLDDLRNHGVEHLGLWQRAVDAERFRSAARSLEMRSRLSGGSTDKPLLLYVGRLSAEKDVAKLKDLFTVLPEMRLAIVGDGPLRRDLERQFAGTATVFTGYLHGEELVSAYASTDLFVMPSQTETLGLVLLEAMAAGCPVVACRAGGVPDAVEHGVTGFLFNPDNKEDFLATVKEAYDSIALLDGMRTSARQDVEEHSWAHATAKLKIMYWQAIRDGAKRKIKAPVPLPRRIAAGIAKGTLRTFFP